MTFICVDADDDLSEKSWMLGRHGSARDNAGAEDGNDHSDAGGLWSQATAVVKRYFKTVTGLKLED